MEVGPHSVPKELILQAHVFSFDCLSPLPSFAWHTAWKGEGTVETGQLAKGMKLLLKCSPPYKTFSLFQEVLLYRWNCAFIFECIDFPVAKPATLLCFTRKLSDDCIANICRAGNAILEPECFWYLPLCDDAATMDTVSYFRHWKWGPVPQRWTNSSWMKMFL